MLAPYDLLISKSASATNIEVGGQLIYSLTYQATSTDTVSVVITDTFDPRLDYVSASITPTSGTGNVRYWTIGPFSGPVSSTIVFTVSLPMTMSNGTILTNDVTIGGAGAIPNSDQVTTTVNAPTLALTKRDYTDPVPTGAPLTYTLIYSNIGGADATNVVITDVLDSNVTFVSASLTPTYELSPTIAWADIGTLTHPVSGEIVITVTVGGGLDEGTILTNTATISSQQTAPFSQIVTTTVIAHGDPASVALTPDTDTITAGQSATYTLTAYDDFGNEWDVASDGTYTITSGAGGSWSDTGTYTSEIANTWTVTGTYSGYQDTATLTVTHASAVNAALTPAVATIKAGESISYTLVVTDAFGNEWDASLSGTYTITLGAIGSWTDNVYTSQIAGTWAVTGTYQGGEDTATLTVEPGALDHFGFDTIGDQIAGTPFTITITAYDAYDNLKTDYGGSADLSDSTGTIVPDTTGIFSGEVWSGSVTITRTGSVVITATDGISSASNTFTVTPAALAYFAFDTISDQIAGTPFTITITAYDAYDNLKTDYDGSADLSDSTGTIVPDTTGIFSGEVWSGSVTITRTGSVVITATDGISSASNTFTVTPAALAYFAFDTIGDQIAGTPFTITITAYDAYDNLKTDYGGSADLSDSTGTIAPHTTDTFSGEVWSGSVTITRTGSVAITATDSISSASNTFTVTPATLAYFGFDTIGDQIAGTPFTITITAYDTYDNLKTDYDGSADLSDSTSTIVPDTTGIFSDEVWSGSVTITRTGSVVITATDGISSASNTFTVTPAALAYFAFDTIGDQIAGTPFTITITAYDAYDNLKTDYGSSADLSDSTGTIVPDTTGIFSGEVWSGSVTITRTGSVVITATDGISSASNTFTVTPATLAYFAFDTIGDQTAGTPFTITITAYDAYDNLKTDYNDTADLSDSTSTIAPDTTGIFSGEVWSGSVTITRTGSVVITATDGVVLDISNAFTVDPAELDHIVLSPQTATIFAWETQPYATEAFDVYENSRGDVTDLTSFDIVQSGHGGSWTEGNVYNPGNHGEWTVWADYLGTEEDFASLTVQAPVLNIVKTAAPDPVEAGDNLTYTIIYSNTGNYTATTVIVTDELDPNVSYVGASLSPDGGLPDAPFWDVGEVAPDGPHQMTLTVSVARPLTNNTTLTNVAWISSDHVSAIPFTRTTTVHSQPILTINKLDYPDPVNAGGILRYTFVVTNSGNENATSVVITEYYDPNASFFSANPPPDVGDNVWMFSVLPVDNPESIDIFVLVDNVLPVGTVLTNVTTLDSDQTTTITATETTAVTSVPTLTVYKLDSPDDGVPAGGELIYIITYQTSGSAPAEGIVITETYDSRVSFVSANPSPDIGNNVWNIGDLPVNSGGNIIVKTRVDTPLTNGTVLTNYVTIDSIYTSPQITHTTTTVSSTPDLTLDISESSDPVQAGDPLTYTLHYRNDGNADATQVVVTATLDANVSFDTTWPAPDGGADDVWYWEIGEIAGEGGEGEIIVRTIVTAPLPNGTVIDLTAQLDDAEGDWLENTIQTTVASTPILRLRKSGNAPTVDAGGLLTYTLTYSNTGNEIAHDVVITDILDANTIYDTATPSPTVRIGDTLVYWDIGTLTPTVSGQITLRARVNSPLPNNSILTNTAWIDSDQTAPSSTVENTVIQSAPILHIVKSDDPEPVDAGAILTYTLFYSNTGNEIAHNVVITDLLDANVSYLSASPIPNGGTGQGAPYWNIGDVAPTIPGQITVRVLVDSPLPNNTVLTNTVTIDSDQTAPQSFQENTLVQSAPILSLDKDDNPDPVQAGNVLIYTINCSNIGNEIAHNVVITDLLDANVSYLSASSTPDGGTAENAPYWVIGDVSPSAPVQITLLVNVTLPLTNGTILTNTVLVNSDQTTTFYVTETTTVESAPDLSSLDKDDGVSVVYAGETLTYTITYVNSGNENEYGITITDTLPSYVEYVGCDPVAHCQLVQPDEKQVVFDIPVLVAQTYGQARLVVRVEDPLPARIALITNHVTMTAPSLVAPISATDVDSIGTRPDLTIAADHTPSLFSPGRVMTYYVTYGNAGQMDAENVVITTTLLTGTVFYTATSGWDSFDGRTYTYTVGQLPAGDTGHDITFTVAYTTSNPQQIGAQEFTATFSIAEVDNIGEDANLDNNTGDANIGVPDLIVTDFTVVPWPVEPDVQVTFTVVLENQGTGMAWNPTVEWSFFVDVFTAPVDSYPWDRYSEIDVYDDVTPIAPNTVHTITLIHNGFSEEELADIPGFYVKVDNHEEHPYGLVPESNELNNVGTPILLRPQSIYLPLVQR